MSISHLAKLYIRINQNPYLHLNKIKLNQQYKDGWHFIEHGWRENNQYIFQFYVTHPTFINHTYQKSFRILYPNIDWHIDFDEDTQEDFDALLNGFHNLFYYHACKSKTSSWTSQSMLIKANAFNQLLTNDNVQEERQSQIIKLLYNADANSGINRVAFENNSLNFKISDREQVLLSDIFENCKISQRSNIKENEEFTVLKNYYLSVIRFLERSE